MSAAGKPLVKASSPESRTNDFLGLGSLIYSLLENVTGCLLSGGIAWRVADVVHLGKRGLRRAGEGILWTCVLHSWWGIHLAEQPGSYYWPAARDENRNNARSGLLSPKK